MLWFLLACQPGGVLAEQPPAPAPPEEPAPVPLELTVDSPAHLSFVGERAVVTGQVTRPDAWVWVEGRRASVGGDGRFHVEIDVDALQRVIDSEASAPDQPHLQERRTVIAGHDPAETWPGAVSMRFTNTGVDHLAEVVGDLVTDLDLAGQLAAVLPDLAIGGFTATALGIDHWPAVTTMTSTTDGIELLVEVPEVVLRYDVVSGTVLGDGIVEIGVERISLGATLDPVIDTNGVLALAITDATIDLADPILTLGGLTVPALESLAGTVVTGLGDLLEGLIDGLIGGIGQISLFGPIAFEADLFGTPLSLSVDRLGSDNQGVAALIGVDLGIPATTGIAVPTADQAGFRSDLAVALHEGVFQPLLQSDLLDLLQQDLELDGIFGDILGLPIKNLPGGDAVPEDHTGWCLGVSLGEGSLVRLRDGIDPMATVVLPEVVVDIGVDVPGDNCMHWLDATLAVEADLGITSGTALGLGLRVVDGSVDYYATDESWDEREVVEGLGGLLDTATSLLGATFELDLLDLIGGLGDTGALGDVSPRILDSQPIVTEAGESVEGLKLLTVSVWD